jgi:ATP-dependent DNA helicase RecG
MTITTDEIAGYLQEPEGIGFEFKEAKSGFHFDRLVEYVVALANAGGGKIILGVTDRRPRHVVGTHAFAEPGRTEAGLFERLRHRVPIEEITHEGQRLLIVTVPPRESGMLWEDRGVAWSRAGDALVPLNDHQRRLIYLEAGPDFSAQVCTEATLADLDSGAIADFRSRWAARAHNDRISSLSDERTLIDAELTGAPLAELRRVLPTLSESAVQRLLDELRSEGRVHLAGSRRGARWRASISKAHVPATNSGGGF